MHYLKNKPFRLVQISPLHTKRMKDLVEGNTPGKTDRKDPRVIADVIAFGHARSMVVPERAAAELCRLTQAREQSVQRKTASHDQPQDFAFVPFW